MTTEWLAGNRIRGTSAERTTTAGIGNTTGGWVELGRTTLGSAGDTISVSSLADKRYYMFLFNDLTAGTRTSALLRFNSDTGTNYAHRVSDVGGADAPSTGRTSIGVRNNSYGYDDGFAVGYVSNLTAKEKLIISHFGGEGAYPNINTKIPPRRQETVGKWVPTTASNVINEFTMVNGESGDYKTGTEMVVLGWDTADTHTTNFWEELASVELGGTASEIDTGTFTAKKYLWVQLSLIKNATASNYSEFSMNGVTTGNTYARRISSNGGADSTSVSQNTLGLSGTGAGVYFFNMFIINNSANEKLVISHLNQGITAGAGIAPERIEGVFKSSNTASQITSMKWVGATNGYDTGSIVKVWGHD